MKQTGDTVFSAQTGMQVRNHGRLQRISERLHLLQAGHCHRTQYSTTRPLLPQRQENVSLPKKSRLPLKGGIPLQRQQSDLKIGHMERDAQA